MTTRERLIGYPETVRVCSEHARPSCQECLNRSLDASAKVAAILFHNPAAMKIKLEVYE